MNKQKRETLEKIRDELADFRDCLDEIKDDEECYRDNMPENFRGSERYKKADEVCDSLDGAVRALEEAIKCINSAKE